MAEEAGPSARSQNACAVLTESRRARPSHPFHRRRCQRQVLHSNESDPSSSTKANPTPSRKGKEVVRNASPSSTQSYHKRRRSSPHTSTPSKRPLHAFDGKELLWPVDRKRWDDTNYLKVVLADLAKFTRPIEDHTMVLNPADDDDSEVEFENSATSLVALHWENDDLNVVLKTSLLPDVLQAHMKDALRWERNTPHCEMRFTGVVQLVRRGEGP
ncbi:hypothetical protein Aspvir_004142 [Aspergillus viridinutans]|uniref:Uncharacterized protein n=1 Tax=Aspergillus viridinutans TaxID=75553 RepID=A0A9P3BPV2_ASPVI|nr:uncharacterized protein Aspvir_004142 [Aspergillus viridinutans]GIK00124.1 hypothetical protein Aspvir_004142 [Aspergillus viridinutans]